MNGSEAAAAAGWADPLDSPQIGSASRPAPRPLQLVPPLSGLATDPEPPAPWGESAPQASAGAAAAAALARANRLLEAELDEVLEELGALQELLEELPAIFEGKFQQRLNRVLQERRQLEGENLTLWSRLRALAPGVDPEIGLAAHEGLQRPLRLLPPASGSAVTG